MKKPKFKDLKFENQKYNEVLEAKTREIKEMQKEINRLNLRVEFWQKKAKKNDKK